MSKVMAWDWKWGPSIKDTVKSSPGSTKKFLAYFEEVIKVAGKKDPGYKVKKKETPIEWWLFGEDADVGNLKAEYNKGSFKLHFGRTADKKPKPSGGLYKKEFIAAAKAVGKKTAYKNYVMFDKQDNLVWEELGSIKPKKLGYSCKISFKDTSNSPRDPAVDPTASSKEPPTPPSAEWTAIQEEITLKMFQHLLGQPFSGVKGFGDQPNDKKGFAYKVIRPMWQYILDERAYGKTKTANGKLIPKSNSWLGHFKRQYEFIDADNTLTNGTYNVFDYDYFMDKIVAFIKGGAQAGIQKHIGKWPFWQGGKISKKDSWNPADIWLLSSKKDANDVLKDLKENGHTKQKVNAILKVAYHKRQVVGISLKKVGKTVKYEEVNLEMKGGKSAEVKHPNIWFGKFDLNVPFSNGNFDLKTNTLTVTDTKKNDVGVMRCGSNQTTPGNITFEFKAAGNSSAQLGKVPMDLMLQLWQSPKYGLGKGRDGQHIIGDLPRYKGDNGVINYTVLPSKAKTEKLPKNPTWVYWNKRVKLITKMASVGLWRDGSQVKSQMKSLIPNIASLKKNGLKGSITSNTAASLQLVEFAYMISLLYEKTTDKKFDFMFENMFYFAQKKGAAFGSRFGPFGKLY